MVLPWSTWAIIAMFLILFTIIKSNYTLKIDECQNKNPPKEESGDFYKLLSKKAVGIFHITNPGTIKHREIIALYEELVDPKHQNQWISNDELVKIGLAEKGRSNNFLHSENLEKIGIKMRPIKEALRDTMQKYKKVKQKIPAFTGMTNK